MRFLLLLLALALPASAAKPENVWKQRWKKQNALERVTKRYEAMLPDAARKPNGEIDVEHPEYKRIEPQWRAEMEATRGRHNEGDRRGALMRDIQEGPLGSEFQDTGSPPRDLGSDVDLTPKDYAKDQSKGHAAVSKLRDDLRAKGYTVVDLDDRIVVREADMTVWKPVRADRAGSSAADAKVHEAARKGSDKFPTEGGMHSTTKGSLGVEDPAGAVVSNMKKAADAGLGGPADAMDLHAAGKSVAKSMEQAGTVGGNKGLYDKAKAVQRHRTDAEAGIVNLGDSPAAKSRKRAEFQKELKGELKDAYEAADKTSRALDADRTKAAKKAFEGGSYQEGVGIRERQIRARASNQAALAEIARTDPQLVKEVAGVDAGTDRGRARMKAKAADTARDVMDAAPEPRAAAPVEAGSFGSQAKKWGSRVNDGMGFVASGFGAAEAEMEAAIRENRVVNPFRAGGRALWEATGIPGATGAWEQAAKLRDEELAKADARWGDKHWGIEARLKASGRMISSVAGWDAAGGIADEEIKREEARAEKAGEEPSYLRSWGSATLRQLGTVVGMDKIASAATRDWPAEARWAKQERTLKAFADARLQENVESVEWVQGRIREVLAEGDPSQPGVQARLDALLSQYAEAREALARAAQGMRKALGPEDPAVAGLYDALKGLPPAEEARAAVNRSTREEKPAPEPVEQAEDPGVGLWIADAAAAAQRCDFAEADRFASYIVRRSPDHSWSKTALDAVVAGKQGQEKARSAMKLAEAKLAADDTEGAAAAAARAAQEAPLCMRGDIGALADRIQARHEDREIEREQERERKEMRRAEAERRRQHDREEARRRADERAAAGGPALEALTGILGRMQQIGRGGGAAPAAPPPPAASQESGGGCARNYEFGMGGVVCRCPGWTFNSSYGACVAGPPPQEAVRQAPVQAPAQSSDGGPRINTSLPTRPVPATDPCASVPHDPRGGSVIMPDGTECFKDRRF